MQTVMPPLTCDSRRHPPTACFPPLSGDGPVALPWPPTYSPSLWAAQKDLALLIKLPTALCFWHQLCCQGPCLAPAVPLFLPQQCVAHSEGCGELSPQHPVSVLGLCWKLFSTPQTVCWEHRAFTARANQMSKSALYLGQKEPRLLASSLEPKQMSEPEGTGHGGSHLLQVCRAAFQGLRWT